MINAIKDAFQKFQVVLLDVLAARSSGLSLPKRQKLASGLAGLTYNVLKIRRKETINSLMLHLDLSREEAEKMGFEVYRQFLLNAFEMASLRYISDEEVLKKIRVEGLENLEEALAKNHGAIVISGHFGLWEFIPQWLALKGYGVCTVVRRQNNKYADKWMEDMRHAHGAGTTDSGFGIRVILRSLRSGKILALMVDQDNGKQGIFVPFFKRWASAPTGPAVISLKTGAPVVPVYVFPDHKNGHLFRISKPIYPESFSKDAEGQQMFTWTYTKELERNIKEHPGNWFWLHRRWKTQPQDAPDNKWAKIALEKKDLSL